MNQTLIEYVKLNGSDALFQTEQLRSFFSQRGGEMKYACQLSLVLDCGDIRDIAARAEEKVSGVALNTAIINTVRNTGLKQTVVQELFSDIFCALDIRFEDTTLRGFDTETGEEVTVETLLSPAEESIQIKKAQNLVSSGTPDAVASAVDIYNRLAAAGSAEAMYRLGLLKKAELENDLNRIYNKTLTAEESKKETETVRRLFAAAAANGVVEAKAELGDLYYEEHKLDKAYEYYSAPGVVSVKPDTKERIVSILNQRKTNVLVMILSGVMLIGMWAFLFAVPASVHHGAALYGLGIPLTAVATLIYAVQGVLLKLLRYQSLKALPFAMLLIWLIYPLVLAIA